MSPASRRAHLFQSLTVLVCLAGALVGAFYGYVSTGMYDLRDEGPSRPWAESLNFALEWAHFRWGFVLVGAAAGGLAGMAWSLLMGAWIGRRFGRGRHVAGVTPLVGAALGLIAGFVSAAMMHVVLMLLYSPAWYGRYILAGLAFAVAPGLVTGLVCGVVWCAALYREGKRAVAEGVLQREQAGATSNGQQG